MFDLNFKENLKEVIVDEVADLIEDQLVPEQNDVQPATVSGGPLHTDKYAELIDLIHKTSKNHIVVQKQQGKNLFAASSVITIFLALVTSVLVQVDVALSDGEFSNREGIQVAITLVGAISSIFARGTEGSQGVYTPHGMIGPNKEDYDGDGIINELDDTPLG